MKYQVSYGKEGGTSPYTWHGPSRDAVLHVITMDGATPKAANQVLQAAEQEARTDPDHVSVIELPRMKRQIRVIAED